MAEKGESPLRPVVTEFPVELNGRSTHIDAILRHKHSPFYFVCEFKRAGPSRANWCFFHAPFVSAGTPHRERIVREAVVRDPESQGVHVALEWGSIGEGVYRLATALKSDGSGEGQKADAAFDDAIKQVTLGTNGLIALLLGQGSNVRRTFVQEDSSRWQGNREMAAFMPVIITTANLWTSDVDLATSDLKTGNVDKEAIEPKRTPWLYFHHAQSPSLKHAAPGRAANHIPDPLAIEYTRTVCVVSVSGLTDFVMNWAQPDRWYAWDT